MTQLCCVMDEVGEVVWTGQHVSYYGLLYVLLFSALRTLQPSQNLCHYIAVNV